MNRRFHGFALVLALLLLASGCAQKTAPVAQPPRAKAQGEIEDLRVIPQRTMYFAERNSPDRPLLSTEQAAYRLDEFLLAFFKPWTMEKPEYGLKSVMALRSRNPLRRTQPRPGGWP
jgi:hypothetical protein